MHFINSWRDITRVTSLQLGVKWWISMIETSNSCLIMLIIDHGIINILPNATVSTVLICHYRVQIATSARFISHIINILVVGRLAGFDNLASPGIIMGLMPSHPWLGLDINIIIIIGGEVVLNGLITPSIWLL